MMRRAPTSHQRSQHKPTAASYAQRTAPERVQSAAAWRKVSSPNFFAAVKAFKSPSFALIAQKFSTSAQGINVQDMVNRDMQKLANEAGIKQSAVPPKKGGEKAEAANTLTIRSSPDGKSISLGVPLPGGEVLVVPLKTQETVRDLIDDIRQEDNSIESLVFRYADNIDHRVAHTTTIADLLKSEFVIDINGQSFLVPVSTLVSSEAPLTNALTTQDVRGLIHRAYFQRIRQRLSKDPRHHIDVKEFTDWCKDYGLSEAESHELLKALHYSGIILYFGGNPQLSQYIFLNTSRVFREVANSLHLRFVKESDLAKLAELRSLKQLLAPMEAKKNALDATAAKGAKRIHILNFIATSAAVSTLAYCVWYILNWDVIEPITFFFGNSFLITGYAFFLATSFDFSYNTWTDLMTKKRQRKLYLANAFNWKKWNTISTKVQELEEDLGLNQTPAPSK